jgi:hypothetical protein
MFERVGNRDKKRVFVRTRKLPRSFPITPEMDDRLTEAPQSRGISRGALIRTLNSDSDEGLIIVEKLTKDATGAMAYTYDVVVKDTGKVLYSTVSKPMACVGDIILDGTTY